MNLHFTVFGIVNKPVQTVYEGVADPAQLSRYFTTGGAKGRLESGETVTWDFHDFPGAFPVEVIKAVPNEKIVLNWGADDGKTTVTLTFKEIEAGRTKVEISEEGWPETEAGLKASYGNCMGWTQFLSALKAYLEQGINLREGMYK
ncbi:SRPBCC family protein [Deinococcus antarcticus]|uniref:SRPBCC family protein n=1 Tax=Deinococcus antarcticus TaxID=1298767 RepID=A0ABV8AAB6_9DEIO